MSFNVPQTSRIEESATRRDATFECLLALGELQEIFHFAHFRMDVEADDPIVGRSKVLFVNDLAAARKQRALSSTTNKLCWSLMTRQ